MAWEPTLKSSQFSIRHGKTDCLVKQTGPFDSAAIFCGDLRTNIDIDTLDHQTSECRRSVIHPQWSLLSAHWASTPYGPCPCPRGVQNNVSVFLLFLMAYHRKCSRGIRLLSKSAAHCFRLYGARSSSSSASRYRWVFLRHPEHNIHQI